MMRILLEHKTYARGVREVVPWPIGSADVGSSVGDHVFVVVHASEWDLVLLRRRGDHETPLWRNKKIILGIVIGIPEMFLWNKFGIALDRGR